MVERDAEKIEALLAKKRKCARDCMSIEGHLFAGTDAYIKADQSVRASLKQTQDDMERKYFRLGRDKVDFKVLADDFRAKNTFDVYGDGHDPNANVNAKEEAKSSGRTFRSGSSANTGEKRTGGRGKKSEALKDKNLQIEVEPENSTADAAGAPPAKKAGPFNLQVKREDVHRMIF